MMFWQIKFLSFIIHGLSIVEYSFSSADYKNLVENCISEPGNCSSVDGKVICYRLCSNNRVSWNDAQRMCAINNSTLPLIRNKKEQESLEAFLKSRTGISVAWTSGRKITHGQWTWLNGQPFGERFDVGSTNQGYDTHVMLRTDSPNSEIKFKQANPLHDSWYMCQYRGNSRDKKHSLQMNDSCVVLSNESLSWYGARNVCLEGGGDLAVLSDEDLKILKNHPTTFINRNYWIGLRNISWQWKFLNDKSEDVKYSKWSKITFSLDSDLCISINTSNGEWLARPCNEGPSVICQNGTTSISTTSTLGPVVTSTSVKNPSESAYERNISTNVTSISPSSTSEPETSSTSTNNPTVSAGAAQTGLNSAAVMYAMIGGGVLLIFIFIIFIFLLLRRRLKGTKEMRNSKPCTIQSNTGSGPEEEPTKKMTETTTASEDELRGVYAEITPAKNSNKDPENAPINPRLQPPSGTVYASLEFKKDAIYAEPVKKSNIVNAPS